MMEPRQQGEDLFQTYLVLPIISAGILHRGKWLYPLQLLLCETVGSLTASAMAD